ncbi:MAG: hypothetical protein EXR07_08225 [Acetobacteraceae bacterium]|nr:hypothetical protein [Acetobacteraceae bacterium]
MPTHTDVLTELAVRYGKCDADSPEEIDEFYTRHFVKLPTKIRDRISFEVLQRDSEHPISPLTEAEVTELDTLFKGEVRVRDAAPRRTLSNFRLGLPSGFDPVVTHATYIILAFSAGLAFENSSLHHGLSSAMLAVVTFAGHMKAIGIQAAEFLSDVTKVLHN